MDTQKKVFVFTDGACKNNGSKTALGGVGVFWGHDDPRNVSCRVIVPGVTNNICELLAIQTALQTILPLVFSVDPDVASDCKYVVVSDSKYAISSLTTWYAGFVRREWKTVAGTNIKNRALIFSTREILDTLGNRVSLQHVKAHSGNPGNEAADALAVAGCFCSAC